MRFAPDELSFEDRQARDSATDVPADYEPPPFFTASTAHTNPKLTWDADDDVRRRKLSKRVTADQLREDDFKVAPPLLHLCCNCFMGPTTLDILSSCPAAQRFFVPAILNSASDRAQLSVHRKYQCCPIKKVRRFAWSSVGVRQCKKALGCSWNGGICLFSMLPRMQAYLASGSEDEGEEEEEEEVERKRKLLLEEIDAQQPLHRKGGKDWGAAANGHPLADEDDQARLLVCFATYLRLFNAPSISFGAVTEALNASCL